MKFRDIKKLDYPDDWELEWILGDLFYKHQADIFKAIVAYTTALEKEKHKKTSLFNEACLAIHQMFCFKGKHKPEAVKRATHIFNLNKTMVSGIHDKNNHYTEEDKKEWDDFYKKCYGIEDFND